jgi:hypothetical protein
LNAEYPQWAPQVLREFHKKLEEAAQLAEEGAPAQVNARIFRLLLTDTNMASVWPALTKAAEKIGLTVNADWQCSWEWNFACAVVSAAAPLKEWEDSAPAEQRKKLRGIAEKARALAEAMKTFMDFDYFYALHLVAPYGSEREQKVHALTGHDPLLLSANAWLDQKLEISLSEVLEKIATDCEQQQPPLTHRNKAGNPELLAFVRRLSASMKEQFGQPMHQCVASIAAALYPSDPSSPALSAERIRTIVRTRPANN